MMGEPLQILLVEDNQDHAELILRGLVNHRVANKVHHVVDGEAALDYLNRRGQYGDETMYPMPHLILLDLRLPKIDGLQVLRELKEQENLRRVPVVVLSTSKAEQDVAKAYDYHANSYLVKPVNFIDFTKLMDDLGFYWLARNIKPNL